MRLFDSALPNIYMTGIKDTPYPGVGPSTITYPIHTPLSFIMAAWGKVGEPYSVLGDELVNTFTAKTFNFRGPLYTHATDYVEVINGEANRQLVTRVPLPDQKKAMRRLSIELVQFAVPQITRQDLTNQPKLDSSGNITKSAETKDGYKYRFLVTDITDDFSVATVTDGVLTGSAGQASKVYPLWDYEATYEGERGNNFAINLFAEDATVSAKSDLMKRIDAYLFNFGVNEVSNGTTVPWYTLGSERTIRFTFAPDVFDEDTGLDYSLDAVYAPSYIKTKVNHTGQMVTGPVDSSHVYDDNIAAVQRAMFANESAVTGASVPSLGSDYRSINFVSGVDFEGNPYYTVAQVASNELGDHGIYLNEASTFRLSGGNDGACTLDNFDTAVRTILLERGRGEVEYNDFAHYPFTALWDSGYSDLTKEAMAPWLSGEEAAFFMRYVFLQTAKADKKEYLTMDEEISTASKLYHTFAAYTESKIWNTPATRAAIVPWAGIINTDNDALGFYKGIVSPNRWLLKTTCKMLGLSTGKWNNNFRPDLDDNKVVDTVTIKNYRMGGKSKREALYGSQALMIELKNSRDAIVSSYQTINPNDSSTLNNIWNVWACITASIGAHHTYKYIVGAALSETDVKLKGEAFFAGYLNGCAEQYAKYTPEVVFTPDDSNAGYAYTTRCGVGMNGGKTVTTVEINSYAMDAVNKGAN